MVLTTMALAVLLVLAPPVYAQLSISDLAADEDGNLVGPRPPEYEVTEDGTLVIGGDVLVPCSDVGSPADPSELRGATQQAKAQMEQARRENIRACEAAGFGTAAGTPPGGAPTQVASASALPETGGSGAPVAALAPLALLVGGLLAFRVVRRDF